MESDVACQDVKLSDHCLAIKPSLFVSTTGPKADPLSGIHSFPFSVFQFGTAAWLSGAFHGLCI